MNPTPAQEKLLELAGELLQRTKRGTIKWKADSALQSFSIRTRNGSVLIYSRDSDGQEPFTLSILNEAGIAIEWLTSEWWEISPEEPREPAPWNSLLEDLYRASRVNAVNLEGVIAGILAEIENPVEDEPGRSTAPGADDDIPF